MSDAPATDTGKTAEPVKGEEPAGNKPDESADKPLGENGEKALKAERTRATAAEKERDALKAELDTIAQANETAVEKAQREAQEAKAEVDTVPQKVADQLRGHLKAMHTITDEDAELYLTSNDPATLLKQATGIATRASGSTPSPRADLTQGGANQPVALNSNGLEDALKSKLGIA